MRSSNLISVLVLLPALATPLPVDLGTSFQPRGVIGDWLRSKSRNSNENTPSPSSSLSSPSSSSSSHLTSTEKDLEEPVLSVSHDTVPERNIVPERDPVPEKLTRPPPQIEPIWISWKIKHTFDGIIFSERAERQYRVLENMKPDVKGVTWAQFLDKMATRNQKIWEADNTILDAWMRKAQDPLTKKTSMWNEKARDSDAQTSQGSRDEPNITPDESRAALEKEQEELFRERDKRLKAMESRYQVVKEWVEKERSISPDPTPGPGIGSEVWKAQIPSDKLPSES